MEPVEVTAHFDVQGKATPLSFYWQGMLYQVESMGRRWETDQGEHILVMIAGGKVFELLIESAQMRWLLREVGPGRKFI